MHYIRYGNSVFAKFTQYLYAICFTGWRIKRSHAVCRKASTLISKRRTLGDIELGLLFEQQGLNLTQIHHEIIESLINGTDRPAANMRTR